MKIFSKLFIVFLIIFTFGCQQSEQKFTDVEKDIIKNEVEEQFGQLITALNEINVEKWSNNYSDDEFISTFVSTDFYSDKKTWVDAIANYFAMRETQNVKVSNIVVTPLSPTLALLTSQEDSEMGLKTGDKIISKHVFSMIWKKEKDGWKILHSHESWVDSSPTK